MSRRVWTGIAGGSLAALVLISVALGAYRAGQHHEVVTRTVTDGQVVRVVDGGWYGPGPGFFLIPLLGIVLVVLLVRGRRPWYGGWNRPYGPGAGPWAGEGGGAETAFREWHRRAHEDADAANPANQSEPSLS